MIDGLNDAAQGRRLLRYTLSVAMLLVVFAPGAAAQEGDATTQGAKVYRYAALGEAIMNVDIWGLVQEPGRYQVAPTNTLVDLITLAGGPDFQVEDTRTARETTVDISREGASGLGIIFSSRLEHITSGQAVPPAVVDGDIITVRATVRQKFSWLDAVSVVGSLASVTFLILRIVSGP